MLLLSILSVLKDWDTRLFLFINELNTPLLDTCMHYASSKFFWIPLYLILFFILIKNYRKDFYIAFLFIVLTIALSDQICLHLFKNIFLRYRPCHNLILQAKIHLVDECGGMYGFVSSHAANTFALASFLFLQFKEKYKWAFLLFFWAAVVSYSRIYLGQHYPSDVAVGGMVGVLVAWMISKMYFYALSKKKHV